MRIAFIVGEFPSLSQTFILNQITGLKDRGHKIDIYANKFINYPKVHPDVERYNLLSHTYYVGIGVPGNRFSLSLKLLKLLLASDPKHSLGLLRSLNVFMDRKRLKSLVSLYSILLLQKPPYDIIHCHFGPNGLKGAMLREIGALQGKLITTFHGFDIAEGIQSLLGNHILKSYAQLFSIGDFFLPISERWEHRLLELGCDRKKIAVHRMGVDCSKFSFTLRPLHNDGQICILTIARLVEKKGVEYGIRAVAELMKIYQNIEYNIVGNGPLMEELQQLIETLNVSNSVKLVGWKQQSEIIELLKSANILLAPSVTSKKGDQEGIPVVLMEAMAIGLPIVSTQHSGIPELVENGISGFLVPERDVDALIEKLGYLVEHPKIRSAMGKAGRAYVEKHHDINKLNDHLIEVYRHLQSSQKKVDMHSSAISISTSCKTLQL